ncbi:hypothetical protein JNB63_04350 [Microbacterium trichothecenolyticum]|uniref:DUF6766 family protein n=1 Tax=Microbacterium trichothecenolyticum TaxID=69370 RepID=UPI001C6EF96C|nr:DUF6766 family protein [Microbacterium trichothecenolyticum]MBW9119315.1 hypothetical protein [Microbacterium trichothecenolyticum]
MRPLRDNALSIAFGALFVLALAGQSIAGYFENNEQLQQHGMAPLSFAAFVTSSDFVVDVAENWQSEFLQFFLFIAATIWLVQRGSPESKKPGDEGPGTDEEQLVGEHAQPDSPAWAKARGIRQTIYSNSLLLVMGIVFALSWLAQSLAGVVVMNSENAEHGLPSMTWLEYLVTPDFWNRTLQNWQSEFLAVGAMIALSIFLRQRGSSESKPVGAPHHETAISGE